MTEIVIRPFEWQRDWRAVMEMVYEVWFADSESKLVGHLSACNFLIHYLRQGTTLLVACEGDTMLGIMAYTNQHDAPLLSAAHSRKVALQAMVLEHLCKVGMYLLPKGTVPRLFNEKYFACYQRMRALVPTPGAPEMLLLLVSQKAQGKGIGRKLMGAAEEDMRAQSLSSYYLLTDSSCNWHFYEIMGMTKALDVMMNFGIPHVNGYDHYLNMYLHALVYTRQL